MPVFEVIKFDGPGSQIEGASPQRRDQTAWLVYKWPKTDITIGSQLVVHQSQEAVFFKDGTGLDIFGPGVHSLSTSNIPLVRRVVNLPFGGQSPFVAEIYFVNKVARLDMLWGTTDPIQVLEPKFQVIVRVRSHGQMGIRIDDSRMFISQIAGAFEGGAFDDYESLQRYFKGLVVNNVKKALADAVVNQKASVFDINTQIGTLSSVMHRAVTDEFKRFGIGVLNFYIESINVVEDDIKKLRSILEGRAEFDVLGDERYARKRTFDTFEKAAENPSGGGMVGAGLGLGLGLGAGAAVGPLAANAFKGGAVAVIKCPACQKEIPSNSQFCSLCGAKVEQTHSKACSKCQALNAASAKFCSGCGTSFEPVACPQCKAQNPPSSKFCAQCGGNLSPQSESKKGQTS